MREELTERIEQFLLDSGGWVSSKEICARFELRDDRILRNVGSTPGLCSNFAISSDKGFKHVTRASTREYLAFKHRMRRHAVGEFKRISKLDRVRNNLTRTIKHPAFTFQKDTGQGVLL